MAKGRMIDRKIRASESFAKLTYRQRDLWQGMIEVADDQGRLPGHPAKIRSMIWAYDDIPLAEINDDLKVLEEAQNIICYSVNGSSYIQLANWHIYQAGSAWLGPSDYPPPEGWKDRCRYHGKHNEIVMVNWDGVDNSLPSKLPSPLPSKLPPALHSREGDVKGEDDIKGEDDVNGEDKEESTLFQKTKTHIEQLTGLPAMKDSIRAIDEIISFGAILADITAGYEWLANEGKTLKYYGQLVGPTRTAMAKRLGKKGKQFKGKSSYDNLTDEERRAKYAEWETGRSDEHQ